MFYGSIILNNFPISSLSKQYFIAKFSYLEFFDLLELNLFIVKLNFRPLPKSMGLCSSLTLHTNMMRNRNRGLLMAFFEIGQKRVDPLLLLLQHYVPEGVRLL